MGFAEYVDGLAKRGVIDGNITELLMAKHREEVANPYKPIRAAIQPVLDEMWNDGSTPVQYANRIDDALTALEGGNSAAH